ncbi:MAG TPA: bifunctional methylenetetrahydrofolate dehydrogenase/methenyltetrahydrofolate cyclohydrolase FolD [Gammaproteobacteria bacterium]|nr:bifunctional methylenetetrahydrofolate dehydrogenase/methenyltetrahydrofolate cyclohydrolase FolD [Gammaproteobacteria bacterium]
MTTYQLLSGKEVAQHILDDLSKKIKLQKRAPTLAVILVGKNPASQLYVKSKKAKAKLIGMHSKDILLDDMVSEDDLLDQIDKLNHDENIDGILVQLPLPEYINKNKIIEAISPKKDVDGFHPINMGRLAQGIPSLRPCTPHGIIRLLKHYKINLSGLNAVIVGASTIVGKPMALELLLAGSTVTVCNSKTTDLKSHINSADLLISATGKRGLIDASWIKSGAIIVDVGQHQLEDGSFVGDLDFEKAAQKSSFITPVPGGVGPMTIAMLLENTYHAALS